MLPMVTFLIMMKRMKMAIRVLTQRMMMMLNMVTLFLLDSILSNIFLGDSNPGRRRRFTLKKIINFPLQHSQSLQL